MNRRRNGENVILDANVPFFIEFLTESTVTLVHFSHPVKVTAQAVWIALEADLNAGQRIDVKVATLKLVLLN